MDRLFGKTDKAKVKEKALNTRTTTSAQINLNTAIFPTWQTLENIDTYTSVDDVY
jgi:hypothetical protein